MTITRFTPALRFAPARHSSGEFTLQDRLSSIFEDLGWEPEVPETKKNSFVPAVDVYEDAQKVTVKLEVPGIAREDLDVRLENQTLTVTGERKFENEAKKENFHRIERSFGSFIRTFTLPLTVDTESIKANYDAGVLTITLDKKPEAKPKQVAIEAGPAAEDTLAAGVPLH
ncbi:MAG: Hsp20/alpha crystallin family protein [Acidobacteria bacterium]|nr:Hsp20/alpha crystallin family protein [Acidobacteriota bacterium]